MIMMKGMCIIRSLFRNLLWMQYIKPNYRGSGGRSYGKFKTGTISIYSRSFWYFTWYCINAIIYVNISVYVCVHPLSFLKLWEEWEKWQIYFMIFGQLSGMEHHHWSQLWNVGITEEQDSVTPLLWRHNERDGASKHRRLNCLLNRFFRRRSKKTSKLHITGFLWGESTGHRWIPLTKCQLRGKCFHLMTSSWLPNSSPLLAPLIVVPTTPVVPATCQHSGSRALVAFYYHMD